MGVYRPTRNIDITTIRARNLLVVAFNNKVVFSHRHRVTRPRRYVAINIVSVAHLLRRTFYPIEVVNFRHDVTLLSHRPMTICFRRAIPFIIITTIQIRYRNFFRVHRYVNTVTFLEVHLTRHPRDFAIFQIHPRHLL